jgi:hypothetical protein
MMKVLSYYSNPFRIALVLLMLSVMVLSSMVSVTWQPGLNLPVVSFGVQKAYAADIALNLEYATKAYSTVTNTTINKPTNTADGDFLISVLQISTNITYTLPAGWTLIVDYADGNYFHTVVAYKRASSESANWTWVHASAGTIGFVQRITGVIATGDPEDCTRSVLNSNGAALNWPSITTATDGAAVIGIFGDYYSGSVASTSLTERIDITGIGLFSDLQATAGVSGNKTGTLTGNSAIWQTILIALRPVASGVPLLTTDNATGVGETLATISGNITSATGGNVTSRGFQLSTTSGNYTGSTNWTENGNWDSGIFSHEFTTLTLGQIYYVRSFGINPIGNGYGSELAFTPRAQSLWGTAAEWTALKALKTAPSHSTAWGEIQTWANTHITDVCPTGNTTGDSYTVKVYIMNMLFMYHMTDNGTYANAALTWAMTVTTWDEWDDTTGGTGSNYRQSTSTLCIAIGSVYYDLHDYMGSDNRTTLLTSITEQTSDGNPHGLYDHYIAPGFYEAPWTSLYCAFPTTMEMICSSLGVIAYAINSDNLTASAAWLSFAEGVLTHEFADYGDSIGSMTQGPGYFNAAMGYLPYFLDAQSRLSATSYLTTYATQLENAGYYPIYFTVYSATHNNARIEIEDTSVAAWNDLEHSCMFEYLLASKFNDGYMETWAESLGLYSVNPDPFGYIWKSSTLTATAYSSGLPTYKEYQGAGLLISRPSWNLDDTIFIYKAGRSLGHAHATNGMLMIYKNGVPLTGDLGYILNNQPLMASAVNSGITTANFTRGGVDWGLGQTKELDDNYNLSAIGVNATMYSVNASAFYLHAFGDMSAVSGNDSTHSETGTSNNTYGSWPLYRTGDWTKWTKDVVIIPDKSYVVAFDNVGRASTDNRTNWQITALDAYGSHGDEPPEWDYNAGSDIFTTNITTAQLQMRMLEPASGNYTSVSTKIKPIAPEVWVDFSIRMFTPSNNVTSQQFLTIYSDNLTPLTVTKVSQGNCMGLLAVSSNRTDVILFSTDGNAVNQQIELGGTYVAADGGTYSFTGTKVTASFSGGYEVMGLEESGTSGWSTGKIIGIDSSLISKIMGILRTAIVTVMGK